MPPQRDWSAVGLFGVEFFIACNLLGLYAHHLRYALACGVGGMFAYPMA